MIAFIDDDPFANTAAIASRVVGTLYMKKSPVKTGLRNIKEFLKSIFIFIDNF